MCHAMKENMSFIQRKYKGDHTGLSGHYIQRKYKGDHSGLSGH